MGANSNMHATDLSASSFDAALQSWNDWAQFPTIERVRLLPTEVTIEHIAYPPPRWKHHDSFGHDGLRFDIWINWDDQVRIEHDSQVVLKMASPAGEIFRAIECRRQARGAAK